MQLISCCTASVPRYSVLCMYVCMGVCVKCMQFILQSGNVTHSSESSFYGEPFVPKSFMLSDTFNINDKYDS